MILNLVKFAILRKSHYIVIVVLCGVCNSACARMGVPTFSAMNVCSIRHYLSSHSLTHWLLAADMR